MLVLSLGCHGYCGGQAELGAVWDSVLQLDAKSGLRELGSAEATRPVRLVEAMLRQNVQPRTRGEWLRAEEIYLALIAEDPSDPVGIESAYWLARLYQLHPYEPRISRARELFDSLWERHSSTFHGQLAFLKGMPIALFDPEDPRPRLALFHEFERALPAMSDPSLRAMAHWTLANAVFRLKLPNNLALAHLRGALSGDLGSDELHGDLLVQLAETATKLGDHQLASDAGVDFLKRFPHDPRAGYVRATYLAVPDRLAPP